jgi:hypothetical protein
LVIHPSASSVDLGSYFSFSTVYPKSRILYMTLVDEILDEAGFSKSAIEAVKAGKLHYGGSLDAASDKELSVKLAFHLKAELEGAKAIFLASPKKKEYDPTVESLGRFP